MWGRGKLSTDYLVHKLIKVLPSMFSFWCEKCCLTLFYLLKSWRGKIVMFLNLHFPDDSHLTTYIDCHHQHLHAHIGIQSTIFIPIRAAFPSTQLVTQSEKVRFVIPLCGVNVRSSFRRSGYSIGRICWKDDISIICSLRNIFPRRFSFLLGSRKDNNKTRKQSGQPVIHYTPTGKLSWGICSHPLLFLEPTANMLGIMYVTHVQAFPSLWCSKYGSLCLGLQTLNKFHWEQIITLFSYSPSLLHYATFNQ